MRYFSILLISLLTGCSTVHNLEVYNEKPPEIDNNDPLLKSRKVFLFGRIDQQMNSDIVQKLIFLDSQNHRPIDLFISSGGGGLLPTLSIMQAMTSIKSPVNTHVSGKCFSGAVILLAAGTGKRTITQDSLLMIHGIISYTKTPTPGLMEKLQTIYTDFLMQRTSVPKAWLPLPMNATYDVTPQEAITYGLADEIIPNKNSK